MEATMSRAERVWFDGKWGAGAPLIGPADHAFWMASTVFDGARAMRGHLPDLQAHCERAIRSAVTLGMEPKLTGADIEDLVRDGMTQLSRETDYYIKMLFYCPGGLLLPDPATTTFALHIFEAPLPEDSGFSATIGKSPAGPMPPRLRPTPRPPACTPTPSVPCATRSRAGSAAPSCSTRQGTWRNSPSPTSGSCAPGSP